MVLTNTWAGALSRREMSKELDNLLSCLRTKYKSWHRADSIRMPPSENWTAMPVAVPLCGVLDSEGSGDEFRYFRTLEVTCYDRSCSSVER